MKGPHKPMHREIGPPCQVCGKPRSAGIAFIDHGKCMDKLAAEALKKKVRGNRTLLSDEEIRMHKAKDNAARLDKWVTQTHIGD